MYSANYERDTTPRGRRGDGSFDQRPEPPGASVRDMTLPPLQDWQACYMIIMLAVAYAVHEP